MVGSFWRAGDNDGCLGGAWIHRHVFPQMVPAVAVVESDGGGGATVVVVVAMVLVGVVSLYPVRWCSDQRRSELVGVSYYCPVLWFSNQCGMVLLGASYYCPVLLWCSDPRGMVQW